MPKVSIVLPTYNGSKYIRESIESVISQTYRDWELIIVDDCSTDGTGEIVEEIAGTDSRISVIHNKTNQTLPGALNTGFSAAKGDYYTWTSDDNMYLSSAVEEMVRYLDENKEYDMVCTNMIIVDEDLRFLLEAPRYDDEIMLLDDMVGACFMYRKTAAQRIGEYDTDFFCAEDYEYWVRLLETGGRIGYMPACYYIYRTHSKNLTTAHSDKVTIQKARHYIRHLDWILSGIRDNTEKIMKVYNFIVINIGPMESVYKDKFVRILPVLEHDVIIPDDKNLILYGAGKIGNETGELLKDRVKYFTDKDKNRVGKNLRGVPIISISEACDILMKNNDYQLVISVGFEKQIEIMQELVKRGVSEMSLFVNAHYKK